MKCPFDITNKKQVIEFEEQDPYNSANTLKGFVNRRQGHLYGSLWVTHVNGRKCSQLIYSAPKQHYPFDKNKIWDFPGYEFIWLYEKIDGTCVIAYHYKDCDGNQFLTYKTRLRPFLGASKFGNFFSLWNEMRKKYPHIDELCNHTGLNFVFELYGKRNKILIDYDVPLDMKCIFAVRVIDGTIIPPPDNKIIPSLEYEKEITKIDEESYTKIQNNLEKGLFIDEENKIMKGKEGYVLYFMKDGHAVQIKNKPPSVLKYHWSGDAVAYESIYTTVINAFENFNEPVYDDVVELLQEEFDIDKIEKSRVRIEKILGKALFDKKLQYELAEDYRKHAFDINKNKVECMRWFGANYPKSQASHIFNLLKKYEGGKNSLKELKK